MSRPPLRELFEAPRAVGTWIKLPANTSVELIALAGFDFVILDMEHAPLSLERVHDLIGTAHGRGIPALVRVPDHTPSLIGRLLDAAADAIIVPHVESAVEAQALVRAATFAPHGARGYGPTVRGGAWGSDVTGYREAAAGGAIIPQLESPGAISAAADIAAVPGLAALFVGPVDLAVASGLKPGSAELRAQIQGVIEVARSRDLSVGTATGPDESDADADFDWLVASNDASLLLAAATRVATTLNARRTQLRT